VPENEGATKQKARITTVDPGQAVSTILQGWGIKKATKENNHLMYRGPPNYLPKGSLVGKSKKKSFGTRDRKEPRKNRKKEVVP